MGCEFHETLDCSTMSLYAPNQEEKERFMSRAIELSNEGPSKGHGGPYGAIIVKDGKIIGERFSSESK